MRKFTLLQNFRTTVTAPQAGNREPENVPSGAGSRNPNSSNRAGSRIQGPQFETQYPMHSTRHVPTAIAPLGNMERTYVKVRKSLPFRHGTFPSAPQIFQVILRAFTETPFSLCIVNILKSISIKEC
jgi:hypothetical protein